MVVVSLPVQPADVRMCDNWRLFAHNLQHGHFTAKYCHVVGMVHNGVGIHVCPLHGLLPQDTCNTPTLSHRTLCGEITASSTLDSERCGSVLCDYHPYLVVWLWWNS